MLTVDPGRSGQPLNVRILQLATNMAEGDPLSAQPYPVVNRTLWIEPMLLLPFQIIRFLTDIVDATSNDMPALGKPSVVILTVQKLRVGMNAVRHELLGVSRKVARIDMLARISVTAQSGGSTDVLIEWCDGTQLYQPRFPHVGHAPANAPRA